MATANNQTQAFDQLWHTLTATGIGSQAGAPRYQVRAASQGLLTSKNERLQRLQKYLRYDLPPGTNLSELKAGMAPICLSFIVTEQGERILVHKIYTGERNKGRPFIHILSGYCQDFSARDAILLWRSSIWQAYDPDRQTQGTTLPSIEADVLKDRYVRDIPDADLSQMRAHLSFLLQAYLTRQPQQHIYIAAPPDEIAYLIQILTACLPPSLTHELTFSTYEFKVLSRPECIIVGTCKAAGGRTNKDLLPENCYTEGLALNCYSGRQSALKDQAHIRSFIDDVIESLLMQDTATIKAILDAFEHSPLERNTTAFLQSYAQTAESGKHLSIQTLETLLKQPELAIKKLSQKQVQSAILSASIENPVWLHHSLCHLLKPLVDMSSKNQGIARALADFTQETMHTAVQATSFEQSKAFNAMLSLLKYLSAPAPTSEIWHAFYHYLLVQQNSDFIYQQWAIRQELLKIAVQVFTAQDADWLRPLLHITWAQFGPLLALPLPKEWTMVAVEELLNDLSSIPTQSEVEQLQQSYAGVLTILLKQMESNQRTEILAQQLQVRLSRKEVNSDK